MKEFIKRVINRIRSRYTISKLKIETGDILLVTFRDCRNTDDNLLVFRNLLRWAEKRNIKGVQIIFLENGCSLQGLREEDMNRAGWFRKKENPGREELLLNAYREKRKWDGVNGRVFNPIRFSEAEKCIGRLERAI